ncbi:MAG: hypothetical protein ACPGVG_20095 [Mycobacterium sp.]
MSPRSDARKVFAGPTWATYRQTIGDRSGLFAAVANLWGPARAMYPGCYLDVAPSTAIPSVTYVDVDRRAARYFANRELVFAELRGRTPAGTQAEVSFLHADYTTPLDLPDPKFDLLISLYTGPVWDHCRQYLKAGGLFLANTSHGDASLAALDPRMELVAAVHQRGDEYRIDRGALDSYLMPKRPAAADPDLIRRGGRGIAYTRTAFAYLFRLT